MLREAVEADQRGIVDVVVDAGMFAPDEVEIVEELLREHLGADHDDHHCVVLDHEGRIDGVAYAEVRPAGDRLWDLTILGVRPSHQQRGDGTALIDAIEAHLVSRDQRLLVIETSSTPQYAAARAFYTARGYDEEARIRDYWTDGDDLVVFRKRLGG